MSRPEVVNLEVNDCRIRRLLEAPAKDTTVMIIIFRTFLKDNSAVLMTLLRAGISCSYQV